MPFSGGHWQSLYKETWICPITEALSLFDDCFLIGKKNYYTFLITQVPIIVDSNKTRQQLHNLGERDTEKVRKKITWLRFVLNVKKNLKDKLWYSRTIKTEIYFKLSHV